MKTILTIFLIISTIGSWFPLQSKTTTPTQSYEKIGDNTNNIESNFWFPQHAAVRNIIFFANNQVQFNKSKQETYWGNYEFNEDILTIEFENSTKMSLKLIYNKDKYASYLVNEEEGEYFVKQVEAKHPFFLFQ